MFVKEICTFPFIWCLKVGILVSWYIAFARQYYDILIGEILPLHDNILKPLHDNVLKPLHDKDFKNICIKKVKKVNNVSLIHLTHG